MSEKRSNMKKRPPSENFESLHVNKRIRLSQSNSENRDFCPAEDNNTIRYVENKQGKKSSSIMNKNYIQGCQEYDREGDCNADNNYEDYDSQTSRLKHLSKMLKQNDNEEEHNDRDNYVKIIDDYDPDAFENMIKFKLPNVPESKNNRDEYEDGHRRSNSSNCSRNKLGIDDFAKKKKMILNNSRSVSPSAPRNSQSRMYFQSTISQSMEFEFQNLLNMEPPKSNKITLKDEKQTENTLCTIQEKEEVQKIKKDKLSVESKGNNNIQNNVLSQMVESKDSNEVLSCILSLNEESPLHVASQHVELVDLLREVDKSSIIDISNFLGPFPRELQEYVSNIQMNRIRETYPKSHENHIKAEQLNKKLGDLWKKQDYCKKDNLLGRRNDRIQRNYPSLSSINELYLIHEVAIMSQRDYLGKANLKLRHIKPKQRFYTLKRENIKCILHEKLSNYVLNIPNDKIKNEIDMVIRENMALYGQKFLIINKAISCEFVEKKRDPQILCLIRKNIANQIKREIAAKKIDSKDRISLLPEAIIDLENKELNKINTIIADIQKIPNDQQSFVNKTFVGSNNSKLPTHDWMKTYENVTNNGQTIYGNKEYKKSIRFRQKFSDFLEDKEFKKLPGYKKIEKLDALFQEALCRSRKNFQFKLEQLNNHLFDELREYLQYLRNQMILRNEILKEKFMSKQKQKDKAIRIASAALKTKSLLVKKSELFKQHLA